MWNNGENLLDQLLSRVIHSEPENSRISKPDILRVQACEAALVVVGSPVTASSYPTEDNSFILTDYHFRVSRLVRAASGFNPDSSLIVVTRPGGVIKVDGDEVSAGLSTEPPLKSGARYLLFLDSGGQPGEFSTRSTFGTYFLDGRNGFLGWRESGDIFFSDAAGTFQSISQLNCGWR
jgi:hypothetical protein